MSQEAWDIGIFDAHCHPTDIMVSIKEIASMKARCLTIMASRSQDQDLVVQVAKQYPLLGRKDLADSSRRFVIPAFGWHPWFSHQMFDDRDARDSIHPDALDHYKRVLVPVPNDDDFLRTLPAPQPLSQFLRATEARLQEYPNALVGEVGLDRAFRLPVGPFYPPGSISNKADGYQSEQYTPGSREGRPLTPYKVSMEHQKMVLRAQLDVAAKLRRPVSIHCVQSHGVIVDILQSMWAGHEKPSKRQQKRRKSVTGAHDAEDEMNFDKSETKNEFCPPYPPRICMHSYSGPVDPLKQFFDKRVPVEFFFSFSQVINFSPVNNNKALEVIRAVPESQILVESDYHCAGRDMDEFLFQIMEKVCEIKNWNVRQGAEILRRNWERFIFGD